MTPTLEFEKPLIELEDKLNKLKEFSLPHDSSDLHYGISLLEEKIVQARQNLFQNLQPIEIIQIARHPARPYALNYIEHFCRKFLELHGDRRYSDDHAIIGGFALFNNTKVMIIATNKGRGLKENMANNFGCAHPEGYRKALRLMKLAEKANCPIITLVDTPGAYPGIGAEERHIGEAIACNLRDMFRLSVPIISVIIGEGGSGGALGLSIGNRVLILENAYYSVITPEGCAAILWRNSEAVPEAAKALKLTSKDLLKLKIVDEIVPEPIGGAHRNYDEAARFLEEALIKNLNALNKLSPEELKEQRYQRFRCLGAFIEEKPVQQQQDQTAGKDK
ncbi:MAG: acetyl-CoA carboxylase carboxyltransferase subunit alpha [Lentisphaeria bacterium]